MKTPTVLRVIVAVLFAVALVYPIFATSVIQPWLKRTLGEDYNASGVNTSLGATGFILFLTPIVLALSYLFTSEYEERKTK